MKALLAGTAPPGCKPGKRDKYIGVGRIDRNHIPISLTSSLRDFNKREAETNPFNINDIMVPVVLVIKKNTSTLKNLVNWLKEHNAKGHNQIIDAPMLLIDDEADNASIDISKSPDEASRINSQIRQTFTSIPQKLLYRLYRYPLRQYFY